MGLDYKRLSPVFVEVISNIINKEKNFPIFYLLSKIEIPANFETQIELAALLTYLRLIWIDKKAWPDLNDFLNLCDHVFMTFNSSIEMTHKLMALITTIPFSFVHKISVNQDSFTDWEEILSGASNPSVKLE